MQAVDELLSVLGVSGDDAVPAPSWHYVAGETDGASDTMTLRDALIQCYDIRCAVSVTCQCRGSGLLQISWAALIVFSVTPYAAEMSSGHDCMRPWNR